MRAPSCKPPPPPLPPPPFPNTHLQKSVFVTAHQLSSLPLCLEPLLRAAAPARWAQSCSLWPGPTPASGVGVWEGGWGSTGNLGAPKLSSGAPAALPAHPSWPANPQIDSSALLIRSLVTVGGRAYVSVCVWTGGYIGWGSLLFFFPSSILWMLIMTVNHIYILVRPSFFLISLILGSVPFHSVALPLSPPPHI